MKPESLNSYCNVLFLFQQTNGMFLKVLIVSDIIIIIIIRQLIRRRNMSIKSLQGRRSGRLVRKAIPHVYDTITEKFFRSSYLHLFTSNLLLLSLVKYSPVNYTLRMSPCWHGTSGQWHRHRENTIASVAHSLQRHKT